MNPRIDSQIIHDDQGFVVIHQYSYGNEIQTFRKVLMTEDQAKRYDLCQRFELFIQYTEKLSLIITHYTSKSAIPNLWFVVECLEHKNNYWDFVRAIQERRKEISMFRGFDHNKLTDEARKNIYQARKHIDFFLDYRDKLKSELMDSAGLSEDSNLFAA